MSRTIEPGISLLTACDIRVVILPIGPMPRDIFDGYLDVFNAHRHVPLNATRSFYQGGPKSPFSHLPYKTGAMHFRFVQADEARRRSRITDLHQQRQVVAVLGLLHCPLVEDIMAAHSEFGRASRQWPDALVARCCAFEPSSTHLATPGCHKLTDLMIFPGGHLHQHLEVYMHEFAAAVLAAIEDFILNASVTGVRVNTYVDSGEFLGSMAQLEEGLRKLNLNEEEVKEKKRWGRFQKCKGDWSLMAGSPRDAFEHYKSAMELSRVAGDAIWYGAAVEGLAHARVLEALIVARPAAAGVAAAAAAKASPAVMMPAMSQPPAIMPASISSNSKVVDLEAHGHEATGDKPAAAAAAGDAAGGAGSSGYVGAAAATPVGAADSDSDPAAVASQDTTAAAAAGGAVTLCSSSSSSHKPGIFTLSSTELEHSDVAVSAALAAPAAQSTEAVGPRSRTAAAATVAEAAAAAHVAEAAGVATDKEPTTDPTHSAAAAAGEQIHQQPGINSIQIQLPGDLTSPAAAAITADASAPAAAAAPAAASLRAPAAAAAPTTPTTPSSSSSSNVPPPNVTSRPTDNSRLTFPTTPGRSSAATATAAAAGSSGQFSYCLSGPAAWAVLQQADLEGEIRELLTEARSWYKKKGGALPLQIEQSLKLCRFVAGLHGANVARREAAEAVGLILESLPSLVLPEDRLIALVEAGQALGLAGCGRKRQLLLWSALDMFRTAAGAADKSAPPSDAAAMMRLALRSLMPHEAPQQQDPDDLPRVHWSMLRFIAWQQQYISGQQLAAARSDSSSKASAAPTTSAHHRKRSITSTNNLNAAAAAASSPKQQQQQQQFHQLLGPQLQLLSPDQAEVYLRRLGGWHSGDASSNPGESAGAGQLFQSDGTADWLCLWDSVLVAVLEAVVNVSKVANAPVEAWEAAATLLRECYILLPQALQASLIDKCGSAGVAMGSRARNRPGPGPGPQVQLKRILPGSPCLQPVHLSAAEIGAANSAAGAAAAKRSEAAAASANPFIFNPYAAKRKGASAAAAAEAALPEWVCGNEGLVEVLLVNPCATPLKLDHLQLVVQPLLPDTQQQQQQQQQQRDNLFSRSESSRQSSAAAAAGSIGAAAGRSVSVSLAAGSKPVRVVLPYVPTKSGLAAITGIQASCWGVSWYQPFVQLPRISAAAAAASGGSEAVTPQGCFTVAVQPPLPLIKAVLHGLEVQLTQPADDELAGLITQPATSSSSSSSWSAPAAAAASSGAAAAGDLDKKVTNVFVFEGQTLNWTLSLTNMSNEPVTGCKVTVMNAKGAVVKPLTNITNTYPTAAAATSSSQLLPQQQQQLPPSFSGAHMEIFDQSLSAGLPLLPGSSVSLPVVLTVGKPPGDAFDAVMLQVHITYYGSATSVTSSSSSSSESDVLGRRLSLPLKLSIQPTLQVTGLRFLQRTVPLKDGLPISQPRSPAKRSMQPKQQSTTDPSTAPAAGVNPHSIDPQAPTNALGYNPNPISNPNASSALLLRRQQSRHTRNSSEGAVPVTPGSLGANTMMALTAAAAAGSATPGSHTTMSTRSGKQVGFQDAAAAAGVVPQEAAAAAAATVSSPIGTQGSLGEISSSSGLLSVGSAPVLELAVRNASERYFRAWLGRAPDHLSAESPLSAVAVLEPGDTQKLTALLPAAAANVQGNSAQGYSSAAAASSSSSSGLCEPSRLHCAEILVDQLVVCWEMITGAAAAAGQLPRGRVQLAPMDVAANITQGAVAALWPSPLVIRVAAVPQSPPPAAAAAAGAKAWQLIDLLQVIKQSGLPMPSTPGLSGPLWGLHMTVGHWLALDLEIEYNGSTSSSESDADKPVLLQVALYVLDIAASSSSSSDHPAAPAAAALAGPSSWTLSGRISSSGGGSTSTAAGFSGSSSSVQRLIDPGVFVAGCYSGLKVQVMPGAKAVHKLRALLVQPGLYQFGVADVTLVGGCQTEKGAAAAPAGGGGTSNSSSSTSSCKLGAEKSNRVYFSQERMFVFVTGE